MTTTTADTASLSDVKVELKSLISQREDLERRIAEASARLHAPGQPGLKEPLIDKEGYPRSDIDIAAVRGDRLTVITLTNDHKALTKEVDLLLVRLHALASTPGSSTANTTQPATSHPVNTSSAGPEPSASDQEPSQPPPSASAGQEPHNTSTCPMDVTSEPAATTSPITSLSPTPVLQDAAGAAWGAAMDVEMAGGEGVSGGGGGSSAAAPAAPAAAGSVAGSTGGRGGASAAGPSPSAVTFRLLLVVDEVSDGSPASEAGLQVGDQVVQFGEATLMDAAAPAGGELQRIAALLPSREGLPTQMLISRQGKQMTVTLTPQRWAGRGLLGCHLRPL
ncbi:MAG: hypothetical protein WDW38_007424 [Sanguina aurantia]